MRRLDDDADSLACTGCNARYPVRNGVPALVTPHSVLYKSLVDEDPKKPKAALGTDADRQRDYWETDTAHRPVDHPIVEGFARQRWRHLQRALPLHEVTTALDVGAGSGFSSVYAPPHLDVTATDGSWRMLFRHPGKQRVLADAMKLPFDDASFDLVFCWELLHHVNEPWQVIAEMARVSRRFVFFFEPNPWNLAQAGFAVADPEHRWVLRFTKGYTLKQVKRAGLRLRTYERCGLIFPNKTPAPLYQVLKHAPFRVPFIGISQLVVAEK